eukprot:6834246-Alexandrium_andersonii.AAC.1
MTSWSGLTGRGAVWTQATSAWPSWLTARGCRSLSGPCDPCDACRGGVAPRHAWSRSSGRVGPRGCRG